MPNAAPFQPIQAPVTTAASIVTEDWRRFFDQVVSNLTTLNAATAGVIGVQRFTLAAQPTLGVSDAGFVGFVTDYNHLVIWDGTKWLPLDGDYPGYFRDFAVAPAVGWQLADGTSGVTYLIFGGASITTGSLTVPNLNGTPSYRKSGAAYTGTIVAATAAGITGRVAALGGIGGVNPGDMNIINVQVAAGVPTGVVGNASNFFHDHDHGTLVNDTTSEPSRLVTLTYFRK